MTTTRVSVSNFKKGILPSASPVYIHNPYILITKDDLVMSSGDVEYLKGLLDMYYGYYDNCFVEVRLQNLFMADNSRVQKMVYRVQNVDGSGIWIDFDTIEKAVKQVEICLEMGCFVSITPVMVDVENPFVNDTAESGMD